MKIFYLITMSNGELYQHVTDTPFDMDEISKSRWLKLIKSNGNGIFYLNIAQILSLDMKEIPEDD